jgi:hypothetical protein
MALNKSLKIEQNTSFTIKRHLFSLLFAGIVILLFYTLIFRRSYIADSLATAGLGIMLYYLDRSRKLTLGVVLSAVLALLFNAIGFLSAYSMFSNGGLGYDKFVHLASSFALAGLFFQLVEGKGLLVFAIVIMSVMGLGAIGEINEFIGAAYFNVNNGGMFTIGDGSPVTSDLQRFDTYYDMIFNFAGAVLGALFFGAHKIDIRRRAHV